MCQGETSQVNLPGEFFTPLKIDDHVFERRIMKEIYEVTLWSGKTNIFFHGNKDSSFLPPFGDDLWTLA